MQPMRGGRGASLLVTLVIVAITGLTSVVADFNTFSSENQLAQATTPAKPPPTQTSDEKVKQEIEEKCKTLIQQAKTQKRNVGGGPTTLARGQRTLESNRCVSGIYKGESQEPVCKGLRSTVTISKDGSGKVTSEPAESVDKGTCETKYCRMDPGKGAQQCSQAVNVPAGADPRAGAGIPEIFKGLSPDEQKGVASNLTPQQRDVLNQALGGEKIGTGMDIEQARQGVDNAQQRLQELARNCEGSVCDEAALDQANRDLQARQAELQRLEEQQQRLADAQKALTPEQPPPDPTKAPPDPTKAPPPDPTKAPPDPTKAPPTGPPNTFPPPGLGGPPPGGAPAGAGSPLSMLGNLLKGLGGLTGPGGLFGPPSCGTRTTYQMQTNYVDNGFGQLVPVQQQVPVQTPVPCPTPPPGTNPGTGTGQPQQCPTPPPQPDPSQCAGGSWRPTYNGVCVANWQCVGGTTPTPTPTPSSAPTAQISCEPDIVDAGMNLAIAYSCSAGTSEGSGFQTNGAQSGTVTVAVASPPANTNTAAYTLKCTHEGKQSTKDCTVQVGKPSIVMVTNPKTVRTGSSANIGWITSGMRSCVISSPQLAAFTAENASRTNVNGTVATPQLQSTSTFVLRCSTLGGATRQASSTITVGN